MKSEPLTPPDPKKWSLEKLPKVQVSRGAPPDEESARSGKVAYNVKSTKDLIDAFRHRPRDADG